MQMQDLITRCAAIAKKKGFNTRAHATQMALIATEVAEALNCLSISENGQTDVFIYELIVASDDFEQYRKGLDGGKYVDASYIIETQQENYLEELADIAIRLFSYIGGNDLTDDFLTAITEKMKKNSERPFLHGKGF